MTTPDILLSLADGPRAGDASLVELMAEIEDYEAWLDGIAEEVRG